MTTTTQHGQTGTQSGKCTCDCAECQGGCCTLECLTRPNFYGGQLLTDGNLKDLVDWVQAKSKLKRFREGWGVVCGLEVNCSHKDKEQNRVYVSKGYAVDCCGRDIVVCDPLWYDFTCETPFDPCCREPKPLSGKDQDSKSMLADGPSLGSIPSAELRAYELCLVFDEKMTGGQRAIVRGNCYPMDECQFTKINEKGRLVAKEIKDPCATVPGSCDDERYRGQLKKLVETLEKLKSSPKSLLDFIQGKLHSFCFVEDWLCKIIHEEESSNPEKVECWLKAIRFYIIQDFRNHYFQTLCETCTDNPCEGDGVPLARVWLRDKKEGNCRICKVAYIDPYPPYRRLLGKDNRLSRAGYVDLSGYIWREYDEVFAELCGLGFKEISHEKSEPGGNLGFWGNGSNNDILCAKATSGLVIQCVEDLCGRLRVVSFKKQIS
jgi:hypothetical protein